MRRASSMVAALLATAARAACAEAVEWTFDAPGDVLGVVNMEPGTVEGGRISGQSAWDPHVSLRVPAEGVDAAKFTWLTVRLYSSAAADLLDVYYESPDKCWCLGGKFPIHKGWATYRMDLTRNHWRETRSGDVARQWGGPGKRVCSFRIDPGNQEGRWVMVDYVKLESTTAAAAQAPPRAEGVTDEPRGEATLKRWRTAATVEAGATLAVCAEFEGAAPLGMGGGTGFARLRRGPVIMRSAEVPVRIDGGMMTVAAELPISAYWKPGALSVETGCYEFDMRPGGAPATAGVELVNPRAGTARPPVCVLRPIGGDPAIFLNGDPLPGMMFCTSGGLRLACHREMARAGIHLYSDWFGSSRENDMGHVEPGRYDYGEYDRYFAAILDVDPQAYFLPHIGVTGPLWWQKAHPEELCRLEDGTAWPPSFASEVWKKEMGDDFRKLIGYLRGAPYADRIIGCIFFNGYTAEWQMWGTWQKSHDDYSAPALRAYRAFLAKRYRTDVGIRAAWNDPEASLAGAAMPKWDKRRPGGPRVLRDPATERQAMDFYEFISAMDADALLHFAKIARDATQGESLVGTYYAYLTAHGINQVDSGHLAARRVFDSPDIDFLMSPPNYWYRKPGEACTFMSATDSLRMRGKLWLDESDNRTHLSDPASGYGRAGTLEETLGVHWREFAEVLTKRAAVSWFDMGGGWFSHPRILDDIGRSHQIMKASLSGRKPFAPEIGVFVDPESFLWMRPTDANAALDLRQVTTMPQSGAPWDFCLLADIADPRLPDYKLYVFLNAFYIDAHRRQAIRRKLGRNGATALFVYAPGYFGPEGASLENMRALTGIRIAMADTEGSPRIVLEPGDPLAQDMGGKSADPHDSRLGPFGAEKLTVAPLFYADDPDARVAGRLVDTGRPGLVVKKADGWTSVYCGAMQLAPALMRGIARSAGVHIWIESDDALYTDNQYLGLHAAADGEKRIHLPPGAKAFDAASGAPVPMDGDSATLRVKRAQTVLLRLERGE